MLSGAYRRGSGHRKGMKEVRPMYRAVGSEPIGGWSWKTQTGLQEGS